MLGLLRAIFNIFNVAGDSSRRRARYSRSGYLNSRNKRSPYYKGRRKR